MSIFITGDTHRDFSRIYNFCERQGTTKDDIMIILGDAGINYYLLGMDDNLKAELDLMPITLFCIHGNHEERPFNIPTYEEREWHCGIVMMKTLKGEPRDFTKLREIARCIDGINCDGTDVELVHSVKWYLRNLLMEDDERRHHSD